MLKKFSRKQLITTVSAASAVLVGVGVGVPVGLLTSRASSPTPLTRDLTKSHAPVAIPYGTGLDGLLSYAPADIDSPSAYGTPVLEPALTTYTANTLVDEDDDAKVAYKYAPKDASAYPTITYLYKVDVTPLQAAYADVSIESKSYSQGFAYVPSLTETENEAVTALLPAGHMLDNIAATVILDADGNPTDIADIMNRPVGYRFSVVHATAISANYVGTPGKVTVNYAIQPSATSGVAQLVGKREIAYGTVLAQDPEAPKAIAGYGVKSVTYALTKSANPAIATGTIERSAVKDLDAGSEFRVVYVYDATTTSGYSYSQYYLYTVTKAAISDAEVPRIVGTSRLPYGTEYTPPVLNKAAKYADWSAFVYKISTPVTTGTAADPRFNTAKEITLADFDDLPAGTVVTATSQASPDVNHSGADASAVYTVTVAAKELTPSAENRDGLWDIGGSLQLLAPPNTVANYRAFGEPTYTGSDGISFTSLTDEKLEAKFNSNPNYTVTQTYAAQPNSPNYAGEPYVFNTTYHLFKLVVPAVRDYQYGTDFAPALPAYQSGFFNAWTRKSPGKVKITKAKGTGQFSRVGEYSDADVKSFDPETEFVVEYTASPRSGYLSSGPITTAVPFKVSARPVSHEDITTNLQHTYGTDLTPPSPGAKLPGFGEWVGGTEIEVPAQSGQAAKTASFTEAKTFAVGSTFNIVFTANPAAGSIGKPVKSTFVYTVIAKAVTPYKEAISATINYGDDFSNIPLPPAAPAGYGSFSLERAGMVYIYKPTDDFYDTERQFATVGYYAIADIARFPTSKTANTEFRVTYVAQPLPNYTGEKAVYDINVKIVPKQVSPAQIPGNALNSSEQDWARTVYGVSLTSEQLARPTEVPVGFAPWSGPYFKVIKALPATASNYLARFALDSEFSVSDLVNVPAGTGYAVYYKSSLSKNYTVPAGTLENLTYGRNFLVTKAPLQSSVVWPDNKWAHSFISEHGEKNWDVIPAYIAKNVTVPTGFGPINPVPKLQVTVPGPGNVGEYVAGKQFDKADWPKLPFSTTFSETYEANSLDENYEPATISFAFVRKVYYSSDSERWVYYPIGETIPRELVATPPPFGNVQWSGPTYAKQPNRYNDPAKTPPVTLTSQEFFGTFFKDSDYPTTTYTATGPSGEKLTFTTTYVYANEFVVNYNISRQFGFDKSKLDPEINAFFSANASSLKKDVFNSKFSGTWNFTGDKVISTPGPGANNFEKTVYDLMQSGTSGLSNWSKGTAGAPAGTVYELYFTSPKKRGVIMDDAKLTLRVTVTPFDGRNTSLATTYVTAGLRQGAPFSPQAPSPASDPIGNLGGGAWETVGLVQNGKPATFDIAGVSKLGLGQTFDYVYRFRFPDNDNVVKGSLPTVEYVYRYTISSDGQIGYTDTPTNLTYMRGSTFNAPSSEGFGPFAGYGAIKSRITLLSGSTASPLAQSNISTLVKGQVFSFVWYYESISGGKEITRTTTYTVINPQVAKTFADDVAASKFASIPYGTSIELNDTSQLPNLAQYGYDKWKISKRVITKTIPTTDFRYEAWMAVGNTFDYSDLRKLPAGVEYTAWYVADPDSFHEGTPVNYGLVYTIVPAEAPVKPIITVTFDHAYFSGGPLPMLDDGILVNPATAENNNVDPLTGKRLYSDFSWSETVLITNLPSDYTGSYKIGQRILWSELPSLPVGAYFNYTKSATLVNANFKNGFSITNYYMRVGNDYHDLPANANTKEQFDPTDLGGANAVVNSIKEQLAAITSTTWDEPSFRAIFVDGYKLFGAAMAQRLGVKAFTPAKGSVVQVYKKPGEKVVTYDIYYNGSSAQVKVEFQKFGTVRDEVWAQQMIDDLIGLKTSYLDNYDAYFESSAGVGASEDAVDAAPKLGLPLDRGFYRGLATISKLGRTNYFVVSYKTSGVAKSAKVVIDNILVPSSPLWPDESSVNPIHVIAPDVRREIDQAVAYLQAGTTTWKSSLGAMKNDLNPFGFSGLTDFWTKIDSIANLTETTGVSVGDPTLLNTFPTLDIFFTVLDDVSGTSIAQLPYLTDWNSKFKVKTISTVPSNIYYMIKPKGIDYVYSLPVHVTSFNADPYATQAATLASIDSTSLSEEAFTQTEVVRSALTFSRLKLGIEAPLSVDGSVFRLVKPAGSKEITFEYYLPNSLTVIKRVTAKITRFNVNNG